MPVLAVPYLLPFAEAAGIAIGSVATALGLKALSDKVQAHMEDNPEESMKILAMIMPAEGLMALFNKEAGEDKVEEEVEVEEEVSSGSEVEEKIKEILVEEGVNVDEVDLGELPKDLQAKVMKGVAKSLGGRSMAEASSILGLSGPARDVKRMADEADVRYEGGVEDVPKPKFDWRSRWRKKAEGGRVGFQTGGALDRSTLNERGKAVYDSMKASRQSDQSIIDQLNVLGLYNTGIDTGIASIVNVQPNIIDQGDGGGGGPLGTQISDFRAVIPQQIPAVNPADAGWYQAAGLEIPTMTETKEPGKLESFIGSGINKLRESKLGQKVGSALGFLGDLPGAGIVTGMVDKMDRFDELPAGDQAFIESMMGYSDPDTNRGNVDPFGINTRSLFGNYADYVKKRNAMYKASGKTYRPGSWQAQNQQFYQAQENERIRQEKEAAEKQAALRQQVQQQAQINRQRGEGGWGTSLGHEGNVGFMTDVAEMGSFKKGGLATMFERRR